MIVIICMIILLLVIAYLIIRNYIRTCVLDPSLYAFFKLFVNDKELLREDIYKTIKMKRWNNMQTIQYIFNIDDRKTDPNEYNRYDVLGQKNQRSLHIAKTVRINFLSLSDYKNTFISYFCLIVKGVYIANKVDQVNNIMRLVNSVPNVSNAYIVCIRQHGIYPNSFINTNLTRCYIPIIESADAGIILNDETYTWTNISNEDGYFVTRNCVCKTWNNTGYNQYILMIDFLD